jgi:hypothetical protein
MREKHQLFFGLRLACKKFHHSASQTKIELHFGGFFHQMKVRQPIGRQDSVQTVNRTSRRLELFSHEADQNFELLMDCTLVDIYTVKKGLPFSRHPSRDVTNQTLPGREQFKYSRPGRVWSVTSRLGTGKLLTFFTVYG